MLRHDFLSVSYRENNLGDMCYDKAPQLFRACGHIWDSDTDSRQNHKMAATVAEANHEIEGSKHIYNSDSKPTTFQAETLFNMMCFNLQSQSEALLG